jgi:DNA-binding beta-propeller fold protein YncE
MFNERPDGPRNMTITARLALATLAPLLLLPRAGAQDPTSRYEHVRKIAVGGEGGWDFLEVDAANRRLYVARGTHVVVVDLETEKVVGEIADTPGVHGIAFVTDLGPGFTSNGGDSSVTVFDTSTLKTLGKVKAHGRPDIIYFEPVTRRVFTMNHGTNDTTAIDPAEMKVVGTLSLGGVPELAASDEKGHVFVNMEDTGEVVEFDARDLKVLNRFSLAPGEGPTGLAFDPKHRKLFSTCANRKLVISDADTRKVVQTLDIGPGPDGCILDAGSGLVFCPCGGDGTLAVIRESSPGRYEVAKTIKTQVSAKTIAMDPKTRRLYLSAATPETGGAEKAAAKKGGGRRRYVPGSFVVLVVGD